MSTILEGIHLVSHNCEEFHIWEWEAGPGIWNMYAPGLAAELEDLRSAYRDSSSSSSKPSSSSRSPPSTEAEQTRRKEGYALVAIGEVQYLLDITLMTQTRLDTNTTRRIRRSRLVGSWVLAPPKGPPGTSSSSSSNNSDRVMSLDGFTCMVIEWHRREPTSPKVFDVRVKTSQASTKGTKVRIDLNTTTWARISSAKEGEQEDRIREGCLLRRLPPPPLIPERLSRAMLWVPARYCHRRDTFHPTLPPFPDTTVPQPDWKKCPPDDQWARIAPFPCLGVSWPDPPANQWTTFYCLGYGMITYQALPSDDGRSRLIDGAVRYIQCVKPDGTEDGRRTATSTPGTEEDNQHLHRGTAFDGSQRSSQQCSDSSSSHDPCQSASLSADRTATMGDTRTPKADEECRICSDTLAGQNRVECVQCRFRYCEPCFDAWLKPQLGRPGVQCPQCKRPVADCRGTQPSGWLEWWILPPGLIPVPGYRDHCTLLLNYDFPDGEQLEGHANPGMSFRGDQRVGFFPYCPTTAGLLPLFLRCFASGRTFTVGESLTTGEQNTLIWGGVHHKTSLQPSAPHGYPDDRYFGRVEEELRAQHIHPESDAERELISGNPRSIGTRDYRVLPLRETLEHPSAACQPATSVAGSHPSTPMHTTPSSRHREAGMRGGAAGEGVGDSTASRHKGATREQPIAISDEIMHLGSPGSTPVSLGGSIAEEASVPHLNSPDRRRHLEVASKAAAEVKATASHSFADLRYPSGSQNPSRLSSNVSSSPHEARELFFRHGKR